jgi:hypothetical protein
VGHKDLTFSLDSPVWDSFRPLEWDAQSHANFLDDDEFDYGLDPAMKEEDELPIKRYLFFDEDIQGEEVRDDSADYLALLAWQDGQDKEEGLEEQLPLQPPELIKEEATRLAMATSELEKMIKC